MISLTHTCTFRSTHIQEAIHTGRHTLSHMHKCVTDMFHTCTCMMYVSINSLPCLQYLPSPLSQADPKGGEKEERGKRRRRNLVVNRFLFMFPLTTPSSPSHTRSSPLALLSFKCNYSSCDLNETGGLI